MKLDRLRYEMRLLWPSALLAPLCIVVGMCAFAILLQVLHQNPTHALLALVEMLLPLSAGVVAAMLTTQESAIELQLTLATPYARTAMLRVGLLLLTVAVMAVLTLAALSVIHPLFAPAFTAHWNPIVTTGAWQLVWAGSTLWLCAVGMCLGLLTRSRTASGTLLGGIWLLNCLFVGSIAQTVWLRPFLLFPATLVLFPLATASQANVLTYWFDTRLWLLGMAAMLFLLNWWLLHDSEGMVKGAMET